MLHIPNTAEENCLKEKLLARWATFGKYKYRNRNLKAKHALCPEKRHKVANHRNVIVRNNPAFDRHDFVPS